MQIRRLRGQVTSTLRGLLNPLLLQAFRDRRYDLRNTLVIAGFPRSGTTWLAEVIATLPGTGIIFEPLNIDAVPRAREVGFDRNNFYEIGDDWPAGEAFLRDVLEGRVLNRWTTSNIPLGRAIGVSRWVVKFVRANQMLSWMTAKFPIPAPVLVIRHPCAVHASWLERGWPLLRTVHPNPRFMAAYPQFEHLCGGLRHPEEFLAARWCQAHYHVLQTPRPWPFQVVFYEQLLSSGVQELDRIMSRWGLALPANTLGTLSKPSAKASDNLSGNAPRQSAGWRRQLDQATINRILAVVAGFGLDFYDSDPAAHLDHPMLRENGEACKAH